MKQETDYILQFRKRIMYFFAVLGLTGDLGNFVAGGFFGSGFNGSISPTRIFTNVAMVVLFITLFVLARLNKLTWAGGIFCTVATITLSISLFSPSNTNSYIGLDSYIGTIYILVIVIAAAFISPAATIFFGIVTTSLYASICSYLISRLPPPAPAEKGANVAILALIMIATMVLLVGFSSSLGRLLRSARQQTDELSQLNSTLQQQRQLQAQIARQISELTSVLSIIFREQNAASQTQATMVSNMAATTQELDATARKIADSALSVATVAEKAQKSVEVGQQTAFQGVGAIASMRQRVQDINDNMHTLDQQIERISEVTNIIGDIADETNLLALNATIEAAGAREYGRRFAAVADEVQRLARRASNAVEQIREMVGEVNQASRTALLATEQGLREAQVGDQLVGSLTVANEDVSHLVAQTSTLANNIAEATKQQREASAQIVEVIQKIIVTANRLIEVGDEVSRVVGTLEDASERLNQTSAPNLNGSTPHLLAEPLNSKAPTHAADSSPNPGSQPLFSFEAEPETLSGKGKIR